MLALAASACGSTTEAVDVAAPSAAEDVTVEAETADEAATEDATVEPEEAAETTTTTPESTLLPSGRERILANHSEGKPYVLWYWGAH